MKKYHLFVEAKCREPIKIKGTDKKALGYFQNFYATSQDNEEIIVVIREIIEADNAEIIKIKVNDFKGDVKNIKRILSDPDMAGVWARTGRVYFGNSNLRE